MPEKFDYRGYSIAIRPAGSGWVADIYPPDSTTHLADGPQTPDADGADALRDEACRYVDDLLSGEQ